MADTLCWFMEFLLRSVKSPSTVANYLSAIKLYQARLSQPTDVFDSLSVRLMRRALATTVRHVPVQKMPITLNILQSLCAVTLKWGKVGCVFRFYITTAFFTFLRASSLLAPSVEGFDNTRHPTWADVMPTQTGLILRVKWSKTHQNASQAYVVPLPSIPSSSVCPVMAFQEYRRCFGTGPSHAPLFLCPGAWPLLRPLTARQVGGWLARALESAGIPPGQFSLHSFRRGGCSEGVAAGLSISELKIHGGWRSDAIQCYFPALAVRDRVASQLAQRCLPANSH